MTTNLIGKQRRFKTRRFDVAPRTNDRAVHRVSNHHRPVSLPTEDEEAKNIALLTKAVFWMAIIAMTPLVLFHIIRFFSPDFFLIDITPY